MQTTWPDEKTLKLAKMEYAKTIGQFTREQIHKAFEAVKRERQAGNEKFEWPNVDAILGLLTHEGEMTGTWGTGAHKPLPKTHRIEHKATKEQKKARAKQECQNLRDILRS